MEEGVMREKCVMGREVCDEWRRCDEWRSV